MRDNNNGRGGKDNTLLQKKALVSFRVLLAGNDYEYKYGLPNARRSP